MDTIEDPPAGDPRRAHRCRTRITTALFCGLAALIVLAVSSAIGGTRSPLHGYVGYLLVAGMALFVVGTASWLHAMVLRRDPEVRIAWAEADARDVERALAELEKTTRQVDAALADAAATAGVTLIPTGDGPPGFPPAPRPAPDRTTATTSS